MLVSIIIPAFNEEKIIEHTLQRIADALEANRNEAFSWEIIVCDNNSTDRTAQLATQAGVIAVFEPKNQIAKARNTGAGAAKGEWLLFVDADTYPPPELIAELQEVIRGGMHVGCGTTIEVVGGTLINKLRMERLNPLYRLLSLCGGAFLLCHREAFGAIAGFSTKLYALEEIDSVIRLKRNARRKGKGFAILYRHPAITSGRKGDYGFFSLVTLMASDFFAVLLFCLQKVLPEVVIEKIGPRLLGYWYNHRK